MTLAEFLGRLDNVVQRNGDHMARCPAHEDARQSLSVSQSPAGTILLKCHAGCLAAAVCAAKGIPMSALFADAPDRRRRAPPADPASRIVATYDYADEGGTVLYRAVRQEPKRFYQQRASPSGWLNTMGDVRRVLYRLDDLIARRPATVFVVEGEKDADALWALGLCATTAVAGAGKWTRYATEYAAQLQACGVRDAVLIPDNDDPGRAHMQDVAASLRAVGITARWLALPGVPDKGDVSDFLAHGGARAQLEALAAQAPPPPPAAAASAALLPPRVDAPPEPVGAMPLAEVHAVFRTWLGTAYDVGALDAVLATAAAEALPGDPCWLNVVAGPGWAKTETVAALVGAGARVVSTIVSDAALLSATLPRGHATDATGGLLRTVSAQARKILVLKDLTSVLSMDKTARGKVLAGLREIHDGAWDRNVGSDGGRTITWTGRIVLIAACTDDWDRHHEVVAKMGDRFLLVRMQADAEARRQSRAHVRANSGRETEMRAALRGAVAGLFAGLDRTRDHGLDAAEWDVLGELTDLVTRLRTAVDRDYSGNVVSAYEAEAPTRFQKQLAMLLRGAVVLGVSRSAALALACRVARDCLPRDRVAVLEYVRGRGGLVTASQVANDLGRVKMTVRRLLEALTELGFLRRSGDDVEGAWPPPVVRYALDPAIDLSALDTLLCNEKVREGDRGEEKFSDTRARIGSLSHISVPPPPPPVVPPVHAEGCDCQACTP